MKRYAALTLGLLILASSSGCCGCLGTLFGMPSGYGGGGCCQPCGGGAYGAGYQMQSSPCGPGGCGGAYAPSSVSPTAVAPGGYQQASVPWGYQTSALNPNPVF